MPTRIIILEHTSNAMPSLATYVAVRSIMPVMAASAGGGTETGTG
jgi:hypothetical protein